MKKNNLLDNSTQPSHRLMNIPNKEVYAVTSSKVLEQNTKHVTAFFKTMANKLNKLEVTNKSSNKEMTSIKERDTRHYAPASKE